MDPNQSFSNAFASGTPPLQNTFNYTAWRDTFIQNTLRIACVVGIALIFFSYPTATPGDRVLFIGMYVYIIAITLLPVRYSLRAYSLLFINFAVGINAILAWGPWADGSIFLLTCIILGSLLFDQRVDIIILGISFSAVIGIAILQQSGVHPLTAPAVPATDTASWLVYTADFFIAGFVLVIALGQFKGAFFRINSQMQSAYNALTNERALLEEKISDRTDELETRTSQLRTSTGIARTVAEVQDINELLGTITSLISEKFGYYHTGLYILDEQKKSAFLQSASSMTGKQLVGQVFGIEPTKKSAFNSVVAQNAYVISSDLEREFFLRDENFPITRSRMILPLAVRGHVFGILDIHSDQPRAFSAQDAEIMQPLADLVAISFDNVRLLNETKNLVAQLELNTSIQTNRTWSKLTSRHKPAYQYTPAGIRPIFARNENDPDKKLLVPLILHGQTIGTIKLKRKGVLEDWSERERVLVDKIAEQVALAVENSRLVDEAQKSALRDQMIATISAKIRETLDIESVVRTAATELRRVFDLKEAEVSVGIPDSNLAPTYNRQTGKLILK